MKYMSRRTRKIVRQRRTMFLLFFVMPLAMLSFSTYSAFAMGFGFWPALPEYSEIRSEDLPFEDVTEQLEYKLQESGHMLVVNPTDNIVVCMVGRFYHISGKSPNLDGSGRRGYKKKETIRLNGVSGTWMFKVEPNADRTLQPNITTTMGTLQCAAVDYVIDKKKCSPGMNIHACVKQGL